MPDGVQKSVSVEASFMEHESALKRFLERFFYPSPEVDVEDILQETFLRTYQVERKQAIRSPKSYLFRVARNLALKELTRKSRLIVDYMGEFAPDEIINNEALVEDKLELDERLAIFAKALARLPPQCRKAFLLRKVYGLSQNEIARRLGVTAGTVEKYITTGLQRCDAYMNVRGVDSFFTSAGRKQRPEQKG